jgi:hypothetical protein
LQKVCVRCWKKQRRLVRFQRWSHPHPSTPPNIEFHPESASNSAHSAKANAKKADSKAHGHTESRLSEGVSRRERRRSLQGIKWIESEKAGHDIGFEKALLDWIVRFRATWRQAARGWDSFFKNWLTLGGCGGSEPPAAVSFNPCLLKSIPLQSPLTQAQSLLDAEGVAARLLREDSRGVARKAPGPFHVLHLIGIPSRGVEIAARVGKGDLGSRSGEPGFAERCECLDAQGRHWGSQFCARCAADTGFPGSCPRERSFLWMTFCRAVAPAPAALDALLQFRPSRPPHRSRRFD